VLSYWGFIREGGTRILIKHYDKLTIAHGGLSALFLSILFLGEPNMFTLPITCVFMMTTAYCALQWHATNLFKKIETKRKK